jgi:hypothetical protein
MIDIVYHNLIPLKPQLTHKLQKETSTNAPFMRSQTMESCGRDSSYVKYKAEDADFEIVSSYYQIQT